MYLDAMHFRLIIRKIVKRLRSGLRSDQSVLKKPFESKVVLKRRPVGIPTPWIDRGVPMTLRSDFLIKSRLGQEVRSYKFRTDSIPGVVLTKGIKYRLTHYENCCPSAN